MEEISGSGAPIYRHEARERDLELPSDPARNVESVTAHVERFLGPVDAVLHEMVSDRVHLDLLHVRPSEERPFHVLVTSGVSDLEMTVPEEHEGPRRVELMLALPEEWPVGEEAFEREEAYWPARWLKTIGRLPHEYSTWIGYGHSIPNGDPAEPIADTPFTGFLLTFPYLFPEDFHLLECDSGDEVLFYSLYPLHPGEMELKLRRGTEALEALLEKREAPLVVDPARPDVTRRRGFFGRFF